MKKFLYILALSLLVCNNGFAGKRDISESKFYSLIEKNELHGAESIVDFLHVSTLEIYKKLLENISNIK